MHLVESALCFFAGDGRYESVIDPTECLPNDSGKIEIYDFQMCDRIPDVGEVREYPEGKLQVVEVYQYFPQQPCPIESYALAVCTVDGSIPRRGDWDGEVPILYLVIDGDRIVEREPGMSDWGIAAGLWAVPKPVGSQIYLFKPESHHAQACTVAVVDVSTARVTVAA